MRLPAQNTQDWIDFRSDRIGASDAPIIMGVSPFKSPYQLWLEKSGRAESKQTAIMGEGHTREEQIRQLAETKLGEIFMPTVTIHPEFDWLMASLDGLSADNKHILECKLCSKEVLAQAKAGDIPYHYRIQLQHQMMCNPTVSKSTIIFWHFGDYATVNVEPDLALQAEILQAVATFYHVNMRQDQAPDITDADYIHIDSSEMIHAVDVWRQASDALAEAKKQEAAARQTLIELTDDGNCQGHGIKITKTYVKGRVKYDAIPELKEVDLEQYRGPMEVRWTIRKVS